MFINLPWHIYKADLHWVPPLKYDMRRIFNKKKHPFFEFGEAVFFLAFKDDLCVGRISAHINHNHNLHHDVQHGFFGFYECMDDLEVSRALLEAAEEWVRLKGMKKIIGPESFTVYDEIGFITEEGISNKMDPVVFHTHTPLYYLDQMEHCGLVKETDWFAYRFMSRPIIKDTFLKIKTRLEKQGYIFRNVNTHDILGEVERIEILFNNAWDDNWAHVPLTKKQFEHIMKFIKLIMDPSIIFFVDKEDQTVAAVINIPDINPAIKKMNGRFFPLGWLQFIRARRTAVNFRTFILGVDKDHRNKGLDAMMIMDTIKAGVQQGYRWADCSLVVETNHRMIEPLEKWGGEKYKTYRLFYKNL